MTLPILTYSALISSSMLCLILNSWILIWVMLEINTLAFCLSLKEQKANGMSNEWSMKYFVIQSVASSLLLMTALAVKTTSPIIMMGLVVLNLASLMVKAASSPFHQWFVSMTPKVMPKSAVILMTWQKIAPTFLVLYQMKKAVLPFVAMSFLLGSILQMDKKNTMEIMALSSVFNLGWMLTSVILSLKVLFVFTLLYWTSVMMMMSSLEKMKMKNITQTPKTMMEKWLMLAIIMNLGGIPPMMNFLAKVMVLKEMVSAKMMSVASASLVLSAINLYIYMRMLNPTTLFTYKNSQKNMKESNALTTTIMMMMLMMPLMIMAM